MNSPSLLHFWSHLSPHPFLDIGRVEDGRSKLLAFVEDALTVIEGVIETNDRLVFWWPAGARRVLFQTSGDWAWEYRKQCKYCKGYKYLDADTGTNYDELYRDFVCLKSH